MIYGGDGECHEGTCARWGEGESERCVVQLSDMLLQVGWEGGEDRERGGGESARLCSISKEQLEVVDRQVQ
jgi:hypothetical protein